MNITPILQTILKITLPFIQNLIKSKVVPALKRKCYENFDERANRLISDLAQNSGKITEETNEVKKLAYVEGTKLGVETLKALAEKLNKAAEEIEKVLEK